MTIPPDLPPAPGPGDGPYLPPPPITPTASPTASGPRGPLAFDRDGLPTVLVAVGVALLSAGVVVSTIYARQTSDLDVSNFVVGVLATLGLLGVALVAHVLAPGDAERRATLVSWPGAFGTVGVGLMIGVLITNDDASAYVASILVVALSVGGYLLVRQAPFVLTTIAGLALLYAKIFSDLFDGGSSGDNAGMTIGAGVLVFVLVVTAAGWLLPATRVLSGVVVGVGGLVAMVVILTALIVVRLLAVAFGSPDFSLGAPSSKTSKPADDPFKNDVYLVLVYCLILAVVWVIAALLTGHVGFRLLVVADAVTIIPLSTAALMAHHPTRWGAVPALLGGLVLAGVGLQVLGARGSRTQSAPPPAYPSA